MNIYLNDNHLSRYFEIRTESYQINLFIVAVAVIQFWFQVLRARYLVSHRLLRLLKMEV